MKSIVKLILVFLALFFIGSGLFGQQTVNFIPKFGTPPGIINSSIFDNGNVGIGTTNPIYKLDVNGNIRASGGSIYLGPTMIVLRSAPQTCGYDLAFDLNGCGGYKTPLYLSYMYGGVGIGTANPAYDNKLQVAGKVGIGTSGSTSGQLTLYPNNGNAIFHIDNRNNNTLRISQGATVGATDLLTISSTGNVGICTPVAGYKMDIFDTSTNNVDVLRVRSGVSADEKYTGILLLTANSSGVRIAAVAKSGTYNPNDMAFFVHPDGPIDPKEYMRLTSNGNLLIGKQSQINTNYRLDVAGSVRANEIVVNSDGADFVFSNNYQLTPLDDLKKEIKAQKHLPGIASAKEMQEKGVKVGELQTYLLQKIEELTLYVIQLKEENDSLKARIQAVENDNR